MTELAVLGSAGKLTTGSSLNQKVDGKLNQGNASLFAAFFQGLTLTSTDQEQQLPNLSQDTVEAEEMMAELYSLMQLGQISLEEAVADFQGLSTDKQQNFSQALAELFANQNSTVQAGQLKGFNFNEAKAPETNFEDLTTKLLQEVGKQGNSSKLDTEIKVQNNFIFNQFTSPNLNSLSSLEFNNLNSFDLSKLSNLDVNNLKGLDLGNLSSLDLSKLNSLYLGKLNSFDLSSLNNVELGNLQSVDLNQGTAKFNNGELIEALKALLKPEQTPANNGTENTIKSDSNPVQEQKGYNSLISNLVNLSNNQSVKLNTEVVDESYSNVDAEVADLVKGELQSARMNIEGDVNRLEAANKQTNIEHLATNRNFSEELGKIMIKSFKLPDGATETKIQLHPQELGQIDVKLVANNGQISAQLITETALGKELLEGQINQLKQSLIQQGYQVDRIEVQQAPQSSNLNNDHKGNGSFNFTGQNSSRQFNRENPNNNRYSHFSEDVDEFVQEMFNVTGIDYTV